MIVRYWALAALVAFSVRAGQTTGRPGYGFVGYGIPMYDPPCAFGCRDSVSAPLNCTDLDMDMDMDMKMFRKRMGGMGSSSDDIEWPSGDGWMVMGAPSAECKMNNEFFLQTFAYCMKTRCPDVPVSQLELFWTRDLAGNKVGQPSPLISYQQALETIKSTPLKPLNSSVLLNYTAIVTDDQWIPNYNADKSFSVTEETHVRYGLVIFLTGAIIPMGLSLLRFLSWPTAWVTRCHAYFIDPPLFGSQHNVPVWGLGIMPTRGQALFIAYLWVINVVLSAIGYDLVWPHSWYLSLSHEVENYVSNRLAILSFANLPLIILYAGRNNMLLWVTNWSRSTFLLLHRWIAFICILQAVIHSLIFLRMYTVNAPGYNYATESQLRYWYWGIIGTLALVILIPLSIQPFRKVAYEAFLASHVVIAILALVGCYLHIWYRYNRQWGYETWLYISVAIWVFDRVAGVFRTVNAGIKTVYVSVIDDDYLRLDIPQLTAIGHVYLHFPTISTWHVWESHPFSIPASTRGDDSAKQQHDTASCDEQRRFDGETGGGLCSKDVSESQTRAPSPQCPGRKSYEPGVTIFLRRQAGITSKLAQRAAGTKLTEASLAVLVEGSYADHGVTFLQDANLAGPTSEFPHLLCIAGGVGISAILPTLDRFSKTSRPIGTTKLYWGVRSWPLVHAVEELVTYDSNSAADSENRRWGSVDVTLSVSQRFDLRKLLESELNTREGGTTVVVCGPPGMNNEVRCIISGLSRHGRGSSLEGHRMRLVVESFAW